MRPFGIFFFLTLGSLLLRAEYRVYNLKIQNAKAKTSREIESTLDPSQYANLYPLEPGEQISYSKTWRCRGRTDFFKPHCVKSSPPTQLPRSPATSPATSPANASGESPEVKK